jgi:hypothetical protein
MTNESGGPGEKSKRAYMRPELRKVLLRPEEAVLGNCKSTTIGGPGQSDCATPASCFTLGS